MRYFSRPKDCKKTSTDKSNCNKDPRVRDTQKESAVMILHGKNGFTTSVDML